MEHIFKTTQHFAGLAQQNLSSNPALCSEIINIIRYYSTDYAESIYQRIKDKV